MTCAAKTDRQNNRTSRTSIVGALAQEGAGHLLKTTLCNVCLSRNIPVSVVVNIHGNSMG